MCLCIYIYIHIPYIFLSSGGCTPFTQVTVQWKGQDVLVKLELDPVAKRFKMRMPDISSDRWCWAGEVDEKAELHVRMGTPVLTHPAKKSTLKLLNFLMVAQWYDDTNTINVQQSMQQCRMPALEDAPQANVDLTTTPDGKPGRTRQPQVSPPKTSAHSSNIIENAAMTLKSRCVMCMEELQPSQKHHAFNCGHKCHIPCLQDYMSNNPKFNPEDACPLCLEEDHAEHDDTDDFQPCDFGTLDADEFDDTLETDVLPALPPEYDNSVQPKRQRELTQDQLDRISERREEAMRRKRQRDITNGTLGNPGNITPQRREALQDGTHLDDTQDMPIQEGPAPVELGPSSENHEAGQH